MARASAYLELTKPGITRMVVVTAAAGFYMGTRGRFDLSDFINTLIGTALVAAGSSALNQLREREVDARMDRTRGRPLPSGRVSPKAAALFSWSAAILGVGYLAWQVNL